MTIRGIPLSELIRPPWRRYVVESRLPRELVIRALKRWVRPRPWYWWLRIRPGHGIFEGSVTAEGFTINRIIQYQNSFLPLITGRFENSPYGTRVRVTMRPIVFVFVFWSFWMGAVGVAIASTINKFIHYGGEAVPAWPVLFGMLLFGYLLASVAFGIEACTAAPMLERILTTDSERPLSP